MLCAVLIPVTSLRGLTEDEMRVICSLAMRRLERSVDHLFVFLISDLNPPFKSYTDVQCILPTMGSSDRRALFEGTSVV